MPQAVHIPCPACGAVNRIPGNRLAEGPVCGRCRSALFPDKPVEVTDSNFATQVGRCEVPVVLDLWAGWCAPCQTMAPVVEAAARELRPDVRVAKMEVDQNPQTAGRLGVRSIPTIVLFKGGQEVDRVAGAMQANQFEPWIRQHL